MVKKVIREKLLKADYPKAFINNVISDNETKQSNKNNDDAEEAEMVILKVVFEQPKGFIMFEIPTVVKMTQLQNVFFTSTTFAIKWVTRKVKTLFSLKDKNPYPSCVVYKGIGEIETHQLDGRA